ncbi:MAG: Eco57I restriction-modification methylase domain-containing protein [Promethearchaeota archaeon]
MSYSDYFNKEKLKDLIEKFINDPNKSQYSEQDVKTKYILPLIEILGWDIHSIDQVKEESPAGPGFVDISLRIYSIPKILIEAKKFGTLNGTRQRRGKTITWEEQTLEYAYSLLTDWCILTNFEELRLFFTPASTPTKAKIKVLKYDNYLTNEGLEIFKYISFKGVLEGLITRLAKKRERRPIDMEIAADLLISNLEIFEILNKKYSAEYSKEELKHFTQRFIERLLILRAAEDWELLRADQIKKLFDNWNELTLDKDIEPFSKRMSSLYLQFNKRFNTAIFSSSPVDELELSDHVYENVINRLYKYNFDKIDVDVLGNVYEEYLGHILKEKEGKYTLTEDYLNKQKHGIYYTKSYIVKYIITKTVLNKIKEIQSQENLKKLKLIDISCGSGTFLVDSFNVLENRYSKIRESNKNNSVPTGTLDSWLAPRFNWKDILTNNIFGIDIDLFATELASVNLALRSITKTEKLPLILDENIFCKNSLFHNYESILGESEGFDFVVGNPPYVLGDNIEEEEKQKLSDEFSEIYKSEADYCFYFIKKGIDLLKEGGRLGFIVARYFIKAHYGSNLRDYILKHCKILEIIDFGNIDVFEGIGSRCCIFIVEKISEIPDSHKIQVINVTSRKVKISKEKIFIEILNLEKIIQNEGEGKTINLEGFFKKQSELTSNPWILTLPKKEKIYNKCKKKYKSLKDYGFKAGRGGIAGRLSIFGLTEKEFVNKHLENEVWKNDIKNSDIDKYIINPLKNKVLFLENINDYDELRRYPETLSYLHENFVELAFKRREFQPIKSPLNRNENLILKKIALRSHQNNPMKIHEINEDLLKKLREIEIIEINNDEIIIDTNSKEFHNYWKWWKWTSPRNLEIFGSEAPKIVAPYIAPENNFAIETSGAFDGSGDVLGIKVDDDSPLNIYAILGFLNSRLYNFLHFIRAKPKDYRFEYYPITVLELPLPNEDTFNEKGVSLNKFTNNVKRIVELKNLKVLIEEQFEQVLLNNNMNNSKIKFDNIWKNLSRVGIIRNRITPGDPSLESIALKITLNDNILKILYFSPEEQEWVVTIEITGDNDKKDIIECLYLLLTLFFKENQIASRTKWRKGQLFSEIICKNIELFTARNLSGIKYLNKLPDLINELKVNVGSVYIDLSSIDNEIRELEQKINEMVYDIFELDSVERKLIENDINFDIPYVP